VGREKRVSGTIENGIGKGHVHAAMTLLVSFEVVHSQEGLTTALRALSTASMWFRLAVLPNMIAGMIKSFDRLSTSSPKT
jgi:hypothetical protein